MPPPRIIVHPMDKTRPVTENAIFTCVGQGYGFVDVSWVRIRNNNNERSLRGKSIVTTMITSDNIASILTIPDLRNNDGERYMCRYNNSEGETDSNQARLTIGCKC